MYSYKNKKVLIFGLGLLGGGVTATNWFLKKGANVTVTDLKTKEQLKPSLKKIRGRVKLVLGGHNKKIIDQNDVIVVNPDVPIKNEFIRYAISKNKIIENEATIFYKYFDKPIIGVTGTRGKTTTVVWTNYFLNSKYESSEAGNSLESPFLKVLDSVKKLDMAVVETPSFQMELFNQIKRAPEIAVITNIYQDHLNRHNTLKNYALIKARIFKNQSKNHNLILNFNNDWTKFLIKQKPKSKVWYFSSKKLDRELDGIFYDRGVVHFQENGKKEIIFPLGDFVSSHGEHNLENLLVSSLAAHIVGCSWAQIQNKIKSLPQVEFRQELVFKNKKVVVVNDTTATSPEGGIAAVKRFASPSVALAKEGRSTCILITGGTDRNLDFKNWSNKVLKYIKSANIIFLSGSATDKMLKLLGNKIKKEQVFETLEECFGKALNLAGKYSKSVVLFSPAAKSFEKFKNEYDRGKKFNKLVKKLLK